MAIYARLENGTYAEVTGVYKTDGTEVTEIFQGDRLVYSASNEIYGSLPLYYNGKGYDLTDYLISGNAVQDGTPSADAPVDAVGSGVRTGNLWDDAAYSAYKQTDGTYLGTVNNFYTTHVAPFTSDDVGKTFTFTMVVKETTSTNVRASANINGISINGNNLSAAGTTTVTFTVSSVNDFLYLGYGGGGANPITLENIMLNEGSTALPYEPYGFKLPLTVNATEYPIYLGTVPTTRRIKKLVLTGEERITRSGEDANRVIGYISFPGTGMITSVTGYCNILQWKSSYSQSEYNRIVAGGRTGFYMSIVKSALPEPTFEGFIAYLAQQYTNGTPVTVWYVLAEPETAVVNEPLMKIGDYADTISFAQAGVTIPTVNGANVLDMTSPVKPSEMCIKGKGIKPTGYGQLADVNGVNILDKDGRPINVHGQ